MPTFTKQEKDAIKMMMSRMSSLEATLISTAIVAGKGTSTYTSLAAMKAEPYPLQVRLFVLLGLNSLGDGLLNGNYYYDATSVATPNDSSVVQLTSTSLGRLLKIS